MLITENIHYTFVLLTLSLYDSTVCKCFLGVYPCGKGKDPYYCVAQFSMLQVLKITC